MGCGVALFILSRSMLHSLELTQQTYYERYNFADVFASLKRAPDSLIDRIAQVPGVAQARAADRRAGESVDARTSTSRCRAG